jgi:hypothetical protein
VCTENLVRIDYLTESPKALLARAHRNVVTVALANKLARIAWAVLARDRRYVAGQTAGS